MIDSIIIWRREEAEGVASIGLAPATGAELPAFQAGAHIDVEVKPGLIRQYSLSNDPCVADHYRIGVLLETNSRGGSHGIHERFKVGDNVRIGRPRNNFPLNELAPHSILVAGGIGITPILSMAYRLTKVCRPFQLHYFVRSRKRAAFISELTGAPFSPSVRIHVDEECSGPTTRPLEESFAANNDSELYVCGPGGFIDHISGLASKFGMPPGRVHVERFNAATPALGDEFEVVAARSGVTAIVPADKSIAEVLSDRGVAVPLSCEQGICGTCMTKVLEGIPDHRDEVQTEQEKAANEKITVCCSRARSARLVLDL